MKRILLLTFLCALISAPAMAGGHYVNGLEGIKAATVPPPGFYLKNYALSYNAGRVNDRDGDSLNLEYELNINALAVRPILITEKKLLGADYGVFAVLPYQTVSVDHKRMEESSSNGQGDVDLSPLLLSWHTDRFDFAFSYEVYLPTGSYNKNRPSSIGKNYVTHMVSAGVTAYLDEERSWSVSVLPRYETHSENDDIDVTFGDDFHFEWGVGKSIGLWDVGVAGYCQWQVTDDSGGGVAWDKSVHDRAYAAGPEVSYFFKDWMLQAGVRYLKEFETRDAPQGDMAVLTLTKIF